MNIIKNLKEQKLTENIRTYTLIGALLIIWVIFNSLTGGMFLDTRNISNLIRQMAIVGILGTGAVLVIVSGNIDLSVGSVLGFISGLSAVLIIWNNWGIVPTIILMLFLGILVGIIQGTVIAYLQVPAFIVTLGGMLIFRGGLLGITKGTSIAPFPVAYRFLGQAYVKPYIGIILGVCAFVIFVIMDVKRRQSRLKYNFKIESFSSMIFKWIIVGFLISLFIIIMNDYRGIPMPVLILGILVIVYTFIAEKTTFGRSIYAIGGNAEAAKYSGINVKRNLVVVYALNGLVAAIAGIILSARLNAGTPTAGLNMELDAIAAAVIGGTSMAGGEGKVAGAILGAAFMATVDNGMSMMNMEAFWQYIVKGLILVIAIWFDIYTKNKQK